MWLLQMRFHDDDDDDDDDETSSLQALQII